MVCGVNKLKLEACKLEAATKLQAGTASVKWCEREWRGYQAGLKEAEDIESLLSGVTPGSGTWGGDRMLQAQVTSEW